MAASGAREPKQDSDRQLNKNVQFQLIECSLNDFIQFIVVIIILICKTQEMF